MKYDGFRALAHLDPTGVRRVSRNGNRFASFTDLCASLEFFLKAKHAVLDGEIVCLDENGCSQFNELWLCQPCRQAAKPRQEQPVQLRRAPRALAASA